MELEFKGKKFTLTQEAYPCTDPNFYEGHATDDKGNMYLVKWEIRNFDGDVKEIPEDELCDWENPTDVKLLLI